jgi:hypothetical protein
VKKAARSSPRAKPGDDWLLVVATGRWATSSKFWVHEEHMNPRSSDGLVAGRPNPEIHALLAGFTQKHIKITNFML